MCTGYTSFSSSGKTLSQCRASCDSSASCVGFSWGYGYLDRRRTLLAHDEPAVAGHTGYCYLMTTAITTSYVDYYNHWKAGCYTKGTLPVT